MAGRIRLASLLLFPLIVFALFFGMLNTVNSDFSWGDINYYTQGAYNFWNGRAFQSSLYRIPSSGELHSPFAYAHQFTNHLNFAHYLLIAPFKAFPNVNTLYALGALYNLLALGFLIKKLTGSDPRAARWAGAVAVLWGTWYSCVLHKGHPVVYAAPLFLLSYIFQREGRMGIFFILAALTVFVQEDCAAWMFAYSFYLWVIEKRKHPLVLLLMGLSAGTFLTYVIWVQKDAKGYLPQIQYASDVLMSWKDFLKFYASSPATLAQSILNCLKRFLTHYGFVGVSLLCLARFARPTRREWLFMLLVPSPYWVSYLLGRAASHHDMAGVCCALIVLAQVAQRASANAPEGATFVPSGSRRPFYAAALGAAFLVSHQTQMLNAYVLVRNVGIGSNSVYNPERVQANKHVLDVLREIPKPASLTFWTSRPITAFIAARHDLWQFPYAFDRAEYLAVQKNVNNSFFEFRRKPETVDPAELSQANLDGAALTQNKLCSSSDICQVMPEDIEFLRGYLMKRGHTLWREDSDLIVFKSAQPAAIERPRFTETLYWK